MLAFIRNQRKLPSAAKRMFATNTPTEGEKAPRKPYVKASS
jgi:hypothetical protein